MATLRISNLSMGDWVKCEGKIYQLTSISNDGEVELEFDHEYHYRCRGAGIDELEPIPITAEIFEKNGWSTDGMYAFLRIDEHRNLEYYFHEHRLRKYCCVVDEWQYHYKPSVALEKIPAMLEGLGIHDYNLDNIIERRVRPIIMNAEYVG